MFELNCGIRLRAFKSQPADDIENILSLYNNIQISPFISPLFAVPRGDKFKKEFQDLISNEAEMFCIIETIPGQPAGTESDSKKQPEPEFIGFTGLWGLLERGHRHTNYAIIMQPKFCNKGYGQKITRFMIDHAFVHMNMHRISLEVYEGNDRAINVYRKQGFIEEGRQRKAMWINGGWKDVIHMGILVEEWKEGQNSRVEAGHI
ncbi:Spermidine N(1)-acetyltransferase [Psilocybe cubensis]|uniref:Spermidine N(1)-acetyltransferase n=2 Tax=Psilocybe cubensis TaxID=181762 RepID=A0ACB8GQW6_PSICU|nr:Spermidine N(1)-acetyltransferase [Psilocybe cubensis]KAH9477839.1 Spermidine N(1)-acetyltransferase [Psilocybe cubensis]